MHKRVGYALAFSAAGFALTAPSAMASYVEPKYDGPHRLRGSNNYTGAWIDQFKSANLNTTYTQAEMWAKSCQDDKFGPDACKQSRYFNRK